MKQMKIWLTEDRCVLDMDILKEILDAIFSYKYLPIDIVDRSQNVLTIAPVEEDMYISAFYFIEELDNEIKRYLQSNMDKAVHGKEDRLIIEDGDENPIKELCYSYKTTFQEYPVETEEDWTDEIREELKVWNNR